MENGAVNIENEILYRIGFILNIYGSCISIPKYLEKSFSYCNDKRYVLEIKEQSLELSVKKDISKSIEFLILGDRKDIEEYVLNHPEEFIVDDDNIMNIGKFDYNYEKELEIYKKAILYLSELSEKVIQNNNNKNKIEYIKIPIPEYMCEYFKDSHNIYKVESNNKTFYFCSKKPEIISELSNNTLCSIAYDYLLSKK